MLVTCHANVDYRNSRLELLNGLLLVFYYGLPQQLVSPREHIALHRRISISHTSGLVIVDIYSKILHLCNSHLTSLEDNNN